MVNWFGLSRGCQFPFSKEKTDTPIDVAVHSVILQTVPVELFSTGWDRVIDW